MKTIKNIILFFPLTFLFFSCQEEMILDESLLEPKIAVLTFLSPNNIIYIKLLHDIPVYQNGDGMNEVPDATITLYEDDQKVEELERLFYVERYRDENGESIASTDTNFYFLTTGKLAQVDKTYRMEIESATYGNSSCETTIPEPVANIILKTEFEETTNNNRNYYKANFKLSFSDPADEENYYRIILTEIKGQKTHFVDDSLDHTIYIHNSFGGNRMNTEDPIFFYEKNNANSFVVGETDNNYGIFTDESINGKDYELSFSASFNPDPAYIDTTNGEFIQYEVLLQSISKDMYYYLKSIDQQEIMYEFPFAEPIPIYTNVENGIGILGSYSSTSVLSPSFGQYPKDGIEYDDQRFYGQLMY
ncbi:MAG: DUF4249 domain-containing protein [Prolixibacteraceae bacterium]|jgi:hypothetical protein|nr:DUF4249 domain-containing protein [Prolixibacteraceae bacterium]